MTESRALGAGLLVSLLINAFFVGVLVTRWLQAEGPHPAGPPPALDLGRLATGLPPALRPQLDEAFRERRAAMRRPMGELVAQRRKVRETLLAEDFDADALRAELERLRELDGALAARAHEALVALAAGLDAQGRRRLADSMGRRPAGAMHPGRPGPGALRRPPPQPPGPSPVP